MIFIRNQYLYQTFVVISAWVPFVWNPSLPTNNCLNPITMNVKWKHKLSLAVGYYWVLGRQWREVGRRAKTQNKQLENVTWNIDYQDIY